MEHEYFLRASSHNTGNATNEENKRKQPQCIIYISVYNSNIPAYRIKPTHHKQKQPTQEERKQRQRQHAYV